jgi:hypothetical protein
MNNSIYLKNRQINQYDLSSTSSNFMSSINKKINSNKIMRGGCDDCLKILNGFNSGNIELALYILKQGNCCYSCKDVDGNTVLHHLVSCSSNNADCKNFIYNLLDNEDCSDFINIQNNQGQTPMLLSVFNGNDELADRLKNAGADPKIQDINGNFIQSETENDTDFEQSQKNVINVINMKITPPPVNLPKKNSMELETDDFMSELKRDNNGSGVPVAEFAPSVARTLPKEIDLSTHSDTDDMLQKMNTLIKNDQFARSIKESSDGDVGITDRIVSEVKKGTFDRETPLVKPRQVREELDTDAIFKKYNYDDLSSLDRNNISLLSDATVSENINTETSEGAYIANLKNALAEQEETGLSEVAGQIEGSDIGTSDLREALNKADINVDFLNETKQTGGRRINGYRKIDNKPDGETDESDETDDFDTDSGINYDAFYDSDKEEYGQRGGAKKMESPLSRMLVNQREKLHEEVLEMLMGFLNKGVLMQNNSPIDANERNAKLVKAFIYRHIAEKNPQMSGMDKILMFKTMSEDEIVKLVNKMPNLDELEKSIQKHIAEKQKSKGKKEESSDLTEMSETVESEVEKKKPAKKTATKTTAKKTAAKKTSAKKGKK